MNIDSIQILRLLLYFIIYSFFGWVLESIFKSILQRKIVNSGFLYGPICPIYGFGAIIMLLFLNKFILVLFDVYCPTINIITPINNTNNIL